MYFNVHRIQIPRLSLLLFFAAFVSLLQACNEDVYVEPKLYGAVRGQVFFSTTQQPAGGALVRVSSTGRSVVTDSSGRFFFDSLVTGSYTLQITRTGYQTEALTVQIDDERTQNVTAYLRNDVSTDRPPTMPASPSPATGSLNVPTTVVLKWKATDPDKRDSLLYEVRLFKEGETAYTTIGFEQKADSILVRNLLYNTTYYWQVVAKDSKSSTVGDVWTFRTASIPDFSFLFARRDERERFQIFASNEAGATFQLTQEGSNWRPVASPNRERIAFLSNIDTETHLYVMNKDGSNLRRVTTVPVNGISLLDLSFCWSPDGTQLLYPSNDKLYSVRTDGTGLRLVYQAPTGRFFAGCDWTEQGNRIVARTTGGNVYDNELLLVSPDGTNPTVIFTRKMNRVSNPVFSVNGQQVLFSLDASGFQNDQGRQLNARIQLLTLSSGALADLSNGKPEGTNDLEPRFSPNGAFVIFTNVDNTGNRDKIRQVFVLDVARAATNLPVTQIRDLKIDQAEMPFWR